MKMYSSLKSKLKKYQLWLYLLPFLVLLIFFAENRRYHQHHTGPANPTAEGETGYLPLAEEGVTDERSPHKIAARWYNEADWKDYEFEAGSTSYENNAPAW